MQTKKRNGVKQILSYSLLSILTMFSGAEGCTTTVPVAASKDKQKETAKAPSLDEQIANIESAKILIKDKGKNIYGSGCVYSKKDGFYYIITNHHVVKGQGNPTENKQLFIVDSASDDYAEDDIQLEVVVSSKTKDAAVVKAKEEDIHKYNAARDKYNSKSKHKKKKIEIFKGEIGNSDNIKPLDTIIVAGYPLTLSGITLGYSANTLFPHFWDERGQDHNCFIISTPISPGNSGSGAYLLRNNKLYLIGLVHALFLQGQNLNLAVKINDFKDMLFTFKNPDHPSQAEIAKVAKYTKESQSFDKLFTIAGHYVAIEPSKKGMSFVFYTGDFPTDTRTRIELIDEENGGYGGLDSIIAYEKDNRKSIDFSDLPKEMQTEVTELYMALAKHIVTSISYKEMANKEGKPSLLEHETIAKLKKKLESTAAECDTKLDQIEDKLKSYQESQQKLGLF